MKQRAGRTIWPVARAIVALFVVAVIFFVGSCSVSSPSPAASPAPQPSAQPGDVISWGEAAASIGQSITVEGPVTHLARGLGPHGQAVLVYVGADPADPQRFVIVIPITVFRRLSADQQERLPSALVWASGTIIRYRGAATIVVELPRNLQIR
jgi:hypothetical protein